MLHRRDLPRRPLLPWVKYSDYRARLCLTAGGLMAALGFLAAALGTGNDWLRILAFSLGMGLTIGAVLSWVYAIRDRNLAAGMAAGGELEDQASSRPQGSDRRGRHVE